MLPYQLCCNRQTDRQTSSLKLTER